MIAIAVILCHHWYILEYKTTLFWQETDVILETKDLKVILH